MLAKIIGVDPVNYIRKSDGAEGVLIWKNICYS